MCLIGWAALRVSTKRQEQFCARRVLPFEIPLSQVHPFPLSLLTWLGFADMNLAVLIVIGLGCLVAIQFIMIQVAPKKAKPVRRKRRRVRRKTPWDSEEN
jgi:hypothetical protein